MKGICANCGGLGSITQRADNFLSEDEYFRYYLLKKVPNFIKNIIGAKLDDVYLNNFAWWVPVRKWREKIMNNINILNKKECTGCSVCEQVCPHNCIKMIETNEGFNYPVVDEKLCTNCGLCVKKCHALNDIFKNDFEQEFYDIRANDEIRMKSSSGGMFTLIADYVLENGGFVCGASWRADWLGMEHIIIDDKKDLDKLRYSKYMESSLGNIFSEIKKLLNENKLVLFTGAPCQVSALNFYLGKYYENLITVDLLCNSVVPQKVWRKYLLEKFKDTEKIEYISFRYKKTLGWLGVS